jgi:hypothetical protein
MEVQETDAPPHDPATTSTPAAEAVSKTSWLQWNSQVSLPLPLQLVESASAVGKNPDNPAKVNRAHVAMVENRVMKSPSPSANGPIFALPVVDAA